MAIINPVPINEAKIGDYVTMLDLLSAGGRFYGVRLHDHFKFCMVRTMRFEKVVAAKPDLEFYVRIE